MGHWQLQIVTDGDRLACVYSVVHSLPPTTRLRKAATSRVPLACPAVRDVQGRVLLESRPASRTGRSRVVRSRPMRFAGRPPRAGVVISSVCRAV